MLSPTLLPTFAPRVTREKSRKKRRYKGGENQWTDTGEASDAEKKKKKQNGSAPTRAGVARAELGESARRNLRWLYGVCDGAAKVLARCSSSSRCSRRTILLRPRVPCIYAYFQSARLVDTYVNRARFILGIIRELSDERPDDLYLMLYRCNDQWNGGLMWE